MFTLDGVISVKKGESLTKIADPFKGRGEKQGSWRRKREKVPLQLPAGEGRRGLHYLSPRKGGKTPRGEGGGGEDQHGDSKKKKGENCRMQDASEKKGDFGKLRSK